jgi:hypothetical protein
VSDLDIDIVLFEWLAVLGELLPDHLSVCGLGAQAHPSFELVIFARHLCNYLVDWERARSLILDKKIGERTEEKEKLWTITTLTYMYASTLAYGWNTPKIRHYRRHSWSEPARAMMSMSLIDSRLSCSSAKIPITSGSGAIEKVGPPPGSGRNLTP